LKIFFIYATWVVFALLVAYTYLSWKKPLLVEKHNRTARKAWYLIFVMGCLVYISKHPNSLFTDWKNYLVLFVAFIIVDSMVFLNLYFSKLGGNELQTEQAVSETQESLDETKRKMENMSTVLNSYAFPEYNDTEEEYIQDFEDLLNMYAASESLVVDLLPFQTNEEQEAVLEDTPKKKVSRLLKLRRTFYDSKDNLMLHPLVIIGKDYVAKVTTQGNNKVTDVDAQVINILLVVYSLTVKDRINQGGDEDGSSSS